MRHISAHLGWMFVLLLAAGGISSAAENPTRSEADRRAVVITVRGQIDDYVRGTFARRLNQARAMKVDTVIIELDTPGGLVGAALDMTATIRGLTDIRTIAFINRQAYSAGTMIALACDEVFMAPQAALGDCAPIAISSDGRLQPLPDTERAKAASPVLADFYASARRNNIPPLLVEAMVQVEPVVYLLVDRGGHYRAVDEKDKTALLASDQWRLVEGVHQPVDGPKTLLTAHTDLAIMLGLARGKAASVDDLAGQRGLNIVARFEPGPGDTIIGLLNNAIVRAILLSLFLTCFYVALHTPGHGMPEVLAVIFLATLLGVPVLTGYAQWWEIAAILLGIALIAMEIFVIPGFGVTGILGLLLLLVGLIMTFVAPEPGRSPLSAPAMAATWTALGTGLAAVVAALAGSLALFWWVRRYLPRLPYVNRLILTTTVGSTDTGDLRPASGPLPLPVALGAVGTTTTDLRPGGSAQFTDALGRAHIVSVITDVGFVARGTRVVVCETGGNRVVVRPAQTS